MATDFEEGPGVKGGTGHMATHATGALPLREGPTGRADGLCRRAHAPADQAGRRVESGTLNEKTDSVFKIANSPWDGTRCFCLMGGELFPTLKTGGENSVDLQCQVLADSRGAVFSGSLLRPAAVHSLADVADSLFPAVSYCQHLGGLH